MRTKPVPKPTRRGRIAALLFASLAAIMPAAPHAQSEGGTEQRNPTLPMVELQAGIHLIRAEVAANQTTRARGLMFRESLAANHGMLFVFEQPSRQCFWMRNTRIPLTIAFLDDGGRIVNTADMKPMSEESHCSARPVRFALEMEQGWFAKKGIKDGDRLAGPKGVFRTD